MIRGCAKWEYFASYGRAIDCICSETSTDSVPPVPGLLITAQSVSTIRNVRYLVVKLCVPLRGGSADIYQICLLLAEAAARLSRGSGPP